MGRPVRKIIVTDQDFADTYRAMESVPTAEMAVIGHGLAPQRDCDNTHLTAEYKHNNILNEKYLHSLLQV